MSKLVYLAGPIAGCTYKGCVGWRDYAIAQLAPFGIVGLSPMRCKEYLAKEESIKASYNTVMSCGKGVTARDRWDTSRCDVVLVNFLGATEVSKGTIMEIAWADILRKPIVLTIDEGNVNDHPMIRNVSGFIVPTLDEGVEVVKALLV